MREGQRDREWERGRGREVDCVARSYVAVFSGTAGRFLFPGIFDNAHFSHLRKCYDDVWFYGVIV